MLRVAFRTAVRLPASSSSRIAPYGNSALQSCGVDTNVEKLPTVGCFRTV